MKYKYDLNKIWNMQRKLDAVILYSKKRSYENTFKERSLAFVIELAEFSNETREFKYWSNKKASNKNILLEEYVDGIHFIVSQGIYFDSKKEYEIEKSEMDIITLTMKIFQLSSKIIDNPSKEAIEKIIYFYLQLAIYYGFNNEDILEHYIKKNKINYKRIEDNY